MLLEYCGNNRVITFFWRFIHFFMYIKVLPVCMSVWRCQIPWTGVTDSFDLPHACVQGTTSKKGSQCSYPLSHLSRPQFAFLYTQPVQEWHHPYQAVLFQSNHLSRKCPTDLPMKQSNGDIFPIEVPSSQMTPACVKLAKKWTETGTKHILWTQNTLKPKTG